MLCKLTEYVKDAYETGRSLQRRKHGVYFADEPGEHTFIDLHREIIEISATPQRTSLAPSLQVSHAPQLLAVLTGSLRIRISGSSRVPDDEPAWLEAATKGDAELQQLPTLGHPPVSSPTSLRLSLRCADSLLRPPLKRSPQTQHCQDARCL
jgi:hypothetical protein